MGISLPQSEASSSLYGTSRHCISMEADPFKNQYQGYEWEKFGAFCEGMLNKHPRAQLLKTLGDPPVDIRFEPSTTTNISSARVSRQNQIAVCPSSPILNRFQDQPDVYSYFLEIMKDFKGQV
jgi:hypothetical protein